MEGGVGGVEAHMLPTEKDPVLAIICCDFSIARLWDCNLFTGGHWGQGRVYPKRLENLLSETEKIKTKYPSMPIIWMNHFAPNVTNEFGLKPNMKLIDCEELTKAAVNSNIEHLLCGHTHLSRRYDPRNDTLSVKSKMRDPSVEVHCAGTSTCVYEESDTTIHFMDIEVDGAALNIETLDLKWDKDKQNFFCKNTPWHDIFFPKE